MASGNFADGNIISGIIKNSKIIAVVGLSDKPDRPSFNVASYLKNKGYKISYRLLQSHDIQTL